MGCGMVVYLAYLRYTLVWKNVFNVMLFSKSVSSGSHIKYSALHVRVKAMTSRLLRYLSVWHYCFLFYSIRTFNLVNSSSN